ncbi:hypothetical protein DPMN_044957 [Dreissena polymorpha]|uniref:Uncharacterized protein n=1 Tax=Dreissena polymorpha TaxID=45954 RepID=A0A9D4HZA1_DREPO|nr:hypothetical protein DPMN_044957 [Dreissena polymorpha]
MCLDGKINVHLVDGHSDTRVSEVELRYAIERNTQGINRKLMKAGIGNIHAVNEGSIILIIKLLPSTERTLRTWTTIVNTVFKILDSIFESLDRSDVVTRKTEYDILVKSAKDGCEFLRNRQLLLRELQPLWLLKQPEHIEIFDAQDINDIRAEKSREKAANKMVNIIASKSNERKIRFRCLLKKTSPYIFEQIWGVQDQTDESTHRRPSIEKRIGTLKLEPIRPTSHTTSIKHLAGCIVFGCVSDTSSIRPSAWS